MACAHRYDIENAPVFLGDPRPAIEVNVPPALAMFSASTRICFI
jgi:hypothetical protein